MPLTLVVPGLLSLPMSSLARIDALASLTGDAPPSIVDDGLDVALLRALGEACAVAPLAARGAGLDVGDDGWLCADPVALVAGHEDVRLTARIDDLSHDEAHALADRLNRHFAGDAIVFEVPRPDRWLLRVRGRPLPQTSALARARGRPLRALLPSGPDAGLWRRWQNEIQMLLHDDPVNREREARGAVAVSGIWFWGGGQHDASTATNLRRIASAAHREADLLRGMAGVRAIACNALPPALPDDDLTADSLLLLEAPSDAHALDALGRRWLAPACRAQLRRRVAQVQLVADGGGRAVIWQARAPSLLGRLRRAWSRPRFEMPPEIAIDNEQSSAP